MKSSGVNPSNFSLRTNENKNDRLAKIKISSQPTGNLRAIAAHLSTAGKINNNIDSNLLFKCFYNMCFVTAPPLPFYLAVILGRYFNKKACTLTQRGATFFRGR